MAKKKHTNKFKRRIREKQKADGFFDGRFRTRKENHGKHYKRKPKYPKW